MEHRPVYFDCQVGESNPLSTIIWQCGNSMTTVSSGQNTSVALRLNASRIYPGCTCLSTFMDKELENASIYFNILFPPEHVAAILSINSMNISDVLHSFSVSEQLSQKIVLTCSAISNPSPDEYVWTGPVESNSHVLALNMTREFRGTYTCYAKNTMYDYAGNQTKGEQSSSYTVEILQIPDIGPLSNAEVVEGNDFNMTCPVIHGNETSRTVQWQTKQSVIQNLSLIIQNVSRTQEGNITCQLNFTMPNITYGSKAKETLSRSFYLAVLYKATILNFTSNHVEANTTVNMTVSASFVCIIDSNPNSTIVLLKNNSTLSLKSETRILEHSISSCNCTDTGIYTCLANNTHNKGKQDERHFHLFVNCPPQQSPSFEVNANVTSAINGTATFQFNTMAYPLPTFRWFRLLNGSEITIVNKDAMHYTTISTNEMKTNFTLENVAETDYGEYLLQIENSFGTFNQNFQLVPEGKPNPPTYYDFFPHSVTSESVTIWWEPGFDGGLPQSFIISYNLTASKWYNESAISHNKERRMNKTITELASSSVYHVLIYAQNQKGAVRVPHPIVFNTKELSINKLTNVGAAVGGAVGGLLATVVVVVVAVFIIVRKRSLRKQEKARGNKCDFNDSHTYTNFSKEMDINTSNADDKALFLGTKQTSMDSPRLPERMPLKLAAKHTLQELDDYDDKAEERIYDNTYEKIKRIERINVSELLPYLTNKPTDFFGSEFTKLPTGLTKPYDFSQNSENIALNRYHGIYPYDHTRVKIADEPSFFINACYIDGYKKKKAFIASLGPLSKTTYNFVTFWKMVWSEKSDVIVMLTKLTEPSGVKCDPYWPKPETTQIYGDVSVASVSEDVYSDYVLRTFTLSKGSETRKLMQFHFMAWPDKSIPEDVTCFLEFRKRVNNNHSSGPIIVHCSAGIGRTGTMIAIEILIEEGRRKGSVNVVECVKTMRDQRTSMVQTVDQYHYIYKALVNALVFDCESIASQTFPKYVDKTNTDQFNKMFQTFNQTVEADSTSESNARTANKTHRDKNRMGSDIPGDSHRVRLFLNRDEETSLDYINAVYIDSFTKKEHFIVAQSPMTNGVEDFLCMIYQVECTCVVSLGDSQQGRNVGMYIPAENTKSLSIGSFNVTCKVLDTKENYVVRKMKIEFKGKYEVGEKDVYHFEYTDWALVQKTPSDPLAFVQFTKEVEEFASQLGSGKSQVLVHCLTAYERSCLFCAVVTLVEKVKYEGEVCVSNTLRHIRARRRLAIPNMEQFQFCFKAVCAYINMDSTGSSIEEKAYINMALA